MIRSLVVLALTAGMCTPASTKPGAPPPYVLVSEPPAPTADAGDNVGDGAINLCPSARQRMVEYGCPPAESFFGEWELACVVKANGQTISICILSKGVCEDMRQCEERP